MKSFDCIVPAFSLQGFNWYRLSVYSHSLLGYYSMKNKRQRFLTNSSKRGHRMIKACRTRRCRQPILYKGLCQRCYGKEYRARTRPRPSVDSLTARRSHPKFLCTADPDNHHYVRSINEHGRCRSHQAIHRASQLIKLMKAILAQLQTQNPGAQP